MQISVSISGPWLSMFWRTRPFFAMSSIRPAEIVLIVYTIREYPPVAQKLTVNIFAPGGYSIHGIGALFRCWMLDMHVSR